MRTSNLEQAFQPTNVSSVVAARLHKNKYKWR